MSPFVSPVVIMVWNCSNNVSASGTVFPLISVVIMDADALEMAHPDPLKLTSKI